MKRPLFLFSFFLLSVLGYAQDYAFPTNAGEYEFSEIVNSSFSKSALFSNAKAWVMDAFNNYKAVVQMESETDGRIVVKGNYENFQPKLTYDNYKHFTYERAYFTIVIDCKDNKYRYKIKDIIIKEISYHSGSIYSGSTEFDYEVKHEYHISRKESAIKKKASIEQELSNVLESLKGKKNPPSKQKKTIENLNKDLAKAEADIKYENDIYIAEYNFFDSICKSIKQKMAINDDF